MFYNIVWWEMEQDAFEIGVWCHFFPREGNEQPLVQNLPTVKGDF